MGTETVRTIEMAIQVAKCYRTLVPMDILEVEARNVFSGRSKAKPHQHAHSTSPI